jgi:hypothetical protein
LRRNLPLKFVREAFGLPIWNELIVHTRRYRMSKSRCRTTVQIELPYSGVFQIDPIIFVFDVASHVVLMSRRFTKKSLVSVSGRFLLLKTF